MSQIFKLIQYSISSRYLLLLFLLFLFGCQSKTTSTVDYIDCVYFSPQGDMLASGQITTDSLQVGDWEFYTDSVVTSKGAFVEGLKFGLWWYNYDDFKGNIDWDTVSISGNVSFSYPNNFNLLIEPIGAKFISEDSLIEIAITRLPNMDNQEHMRTQIRENLTENGWEIMRQNCTRIWFKNRGSYSVFYDIKQGDVRGICYTMLLKEKGKGAILATMTSRNMPAGKYQYVMVVFLGVLENIIINRELLLNTTQMVEKDC